jgi:hypothetical protein
MVELEKKIKNKDVPLMSRVYPAAFIHHLFCMGISSDYFMDDDVEEG